MTSVCQATIISTKDVTCVCPAARPIFILIFQRVIQWMEAAPLDVHKTGMGINAICTVAFFV